MVLKEEVETGKFLKVEGLHKKKREFSHLKFLFHDGKVTAALILLVLLRIFPCEST